MTESSAVDDASRALGELRGDALTDLILRAPSAALGAALDNPKLEENQLMLMLRRPDVSAEVLQRLSDHKRWIGSYLVKSAMVAHPHTPKTVAMGLVKFLFWRDLARLLNNAGVDAVIRRVAEVNLRDRLHEISLGERIALARMAPREVIKALRREDNERVMAALLENPRTTEDDLLVIVNSLKTSPAILTLIARSERWMARRSLRAALMRNPRVPARCSLPLLSGLSEIDLRGLAETPAVHQVIRSAAKRLLVERRVRGK